MMELIERRGAPTKSGSSCVFFSDLPRNRDLGTGSLKWPGSVLGDE